VFRLLAALLGVLFIAPAVRATTAAVDHPGSLPILLGVEKVRAELRLDSLQRALLDSLRDEYKSAARGLTATMPKTPEERATAQARLLRLNERFNKRALSVLNPSQRAKLSAIEARFLGATVLYSPGVQAKLKLTKEQKRQIEAIRQKGIAFVGKVNRRFEEGKIGQQERLQLLRSRRMAQAAEMLRLLTPEQRGALLALGGKKVAS
jgi:Spy/CpxP family protein refolding chaperone